MDLIHKRVMLNNRNQTTVKVITQQRYITHLHKVAYNRKYSVIVPLNYKRDGFIETVHFNCWRQTSSCQGLLTYIEDFVAIVHNTMNNVRRRRTVWTDWTVWNVLVTKFTRKEAQIFGKFLGSFEKCHFKQTLLCLILVFFGRNWETFYSSIWSHWGWMLKFDQFLESIHLFTEIC